MVTPIKPLWDDYIGGQLTVVKYISQHAMRLLVTNDNNRDGSPFFRVWNDLKATNESR